MYKAFYGLREKPFNLTPDPRFLYLSEKHKEAFAHLLYGIRSRSGFVMVTGEIGTGKTTICRNLLNQLDEDTEVAFIFNPMLSPLELLRKIVSEFGIDARGANALELTEELNEYLLEAAAKGKNCVLLIDEAQNLDPQVLEQIRLLSNLETETEKLLQIVLIGQPELGEKLELHELRQLNQRITARYHLRPLSEKEVLQYIAYRLHVAGGRRGVKFARAAVRAVYRISKGTPRVINAVCDRALLIGFTKEVHVITKGIVQRAYKEIRGDAVFGKPQPRLSLRRLLWNPVAAVAAACILAAVYFNSPALQARTNAVLERAAAALPAPPAEPEAEGIVEAKAEPAPAPDLASAILADVSAPEPEPSPADTPAPTPTETIPAPATAPSTAPAAAPAPPATTLDLAGALAEVPVADSDAAALQMLLAAWKRPLKASLPAAINDSTLDAFLRGHEWVYDRLKPSLNQLVAVDLPALVKVFVNGETRWLTLVQAQGESITVTTAPGKTAAIPRDTFLNAYAAEAVIPWNDPAPGSRALREGQAGAEVASLKESLRKLARLRAENTTDAYDVETASAISRLQAETSLDVDGIAGKQVRMVLSSWLKDSSTPGLKGPIPAIDPTMLARRTPPAPPAPSAQSEVIAKPAAKPVSKPPAEDPAPEATAEAPAKEPASEPAPAAKENPTAAEATGAEAPPADPSPAAPVAAEATTAAPATDAPAGTATPASEPATTTEAAPITLTNVDRTGNETESDSGALPAATAAVEASPGAADASTTTRTTSGVKLVVTELDDPGSLPPEEEAKTETPPPSEG